MSRRLGLRRAMIVTLALIVAASVPATASAGTADGNHCRLPDGTDFNELWGVTEAIVWFPCLEIGSGQDWRVAGLWGVNATFKKVPKEFVPAGATPLDDYLAKFEGVKIVVDPGTSSERTYRFTDTSRLIVQETSFGASVNVVAMGVLAPLSVGTHVVESFMMLRGMHCDGFSRDCIGPGDVLHFSGEVTVTAGN